jgi:inner membrane transporter RhtA
MPAKRYGVLISLEPVVAIFVGMALLAETIGARAWIAILLITLASIGVALLQKAEASATVAQNMPG